MISITITEERYAQLLEYEKRCSRKAKPKMGSTKADDNKHLLMDAIRASMVKDSIIGNVCVTSSARDIFKTLREGSDGAKNIAFQRAITALVEDGIISVKDPRRITILSSKP